MESLLFVNSLDHIAAIKLNVTEQIDMIRTFHRQRPHNLKKAKKANFQANRVAKNQCF